MTRALRTLRLEQNGRDLLVLLPGAYMQPEDFVTAGFFTRTEAHAPLLDLIAVDLGLDSISSGQALPLVVKEILEPARANYQRVWLGGISLGGLLALSQAADHPESIDGLCLIAPYPGSRLTRNAIEQAGGLANWQISPEQHRDPEFRIWHWLKSPPPNLPVFVGYGTEDRFSEGMSQVAECFAPACRHNVSGGHDWAAWQFLWTDFLAANHFPA